MNGTYTLGTNGRLNAATVTNNGTIDTSGSFNASNQITNNNAFTINGGTVTTPLFTNNGTFTQADGVFTASTRSRMPARSRSTAAR